MNKIVPIATCKIPVCSPQAVLQRLSKSVPQRLWRQCMQLWQSQWRLQRTELQSGKVLTSPLQRSNLASKTQKRNTSLKDIKWFEQNPYVFHSKYISFWYVQWSKSRGFLKADLFSHNIYSLPFSWVDNWCDRWNPFPRKNLVSSANFSENNSNWCLAMYCTKWINVSILFAIFYQLESWREAAEFPFCSRHINLGLAINTTY